MPALRRSEAATACTARSQPLDVWPSRHSLHAIAAQLSPAQGCTGIELLLADTFDLHCFQTLTGTKMIMVVQPNTPDIDALLQDTCALSRCFPTAALAQPCMQAQHSGAQSTVHSVSVRAAQLCTEAHMGKPGDHLCELAAMDVRRYLMCWVMWLCRVYDLYCDYVLKNPFYEVEMPIRCELFDQNLFRLINSVHRRWGVIQ